MNSRIILFIGSMAMAVILMSSISNSSHSPGGKSSSPGDGADCTTCHAGTANTATNWITSNIPASGYVPGATYTITLTGTHTGVARFGFELTAEDAANTKAGAFTITNNTETDFTNGGHAVTHTAMGLAPSGDSKTWSMDWTAPSAGSGDITFYASLNAANGNSSSSGDVIYNTMHTVTEDLSIGIDAATDHANFHIYPNPATDVITISSDDNSNYEYQVMDINGRVLLSEKIDNSLTANQIDLSNLPKGSYIIQIKNNKTLISKQFIKQ